MVKNLNHITISLYHILVAICTGVVLSRRAKHKTVVKLGKYGDTVSAQPI